MSVPIGETSTGVTYGATALLGHHLVILAQGLRDFWSHPLPARLYVIDLRDQSVQEDTSFQTVFEGYENYSFTAYGDNQIILFGGERSEVATNRMVWMTIQSFNRKLFLN